MHLLYVRYGTVESNHGSVLNGCSELTVTLRVISACLTASQQMDDWAGYRPYYEKLRCGASDCQRYSTVVRRASIYCSGLPVPEYCNSNNIHCSFSEVRTCLLRW